MIKSMCKSRLPEVPYSFTHLLSRVKNGIKSGIKGENRRKKREKKIEILWNQKKGLTLQSQNAAELT